MAVHRTRVLASVLAAALTTAVAVVAAPSAHAASRVSYCFVWAQDTTDGAARLPKSDRHKAGTAYAHEPVRLIQVVNDRKRVVRTGRTDSKGCGVFSGTPTRGRLFVRAVTTFSSGEPGGGTFVDFWSGRTYSVGPGDGQHHLGTGLVKLRGSIGGGVSRDRG